MGEMDRLQQQKRSSRQCHGISAKVSSFFDLKSGRKGAFDGNNGEDGLRKNQMSETATKPDIKSGGRLPDVENSLSMEFKRRSSSKGSGTPMKTLLAQEMSEEMELRHRSPGVVARLMGLDALPAQQSVYKPQKASGSHFHTARSLGLQEKYVMREDQFQANESLGLQEFKDVYEVRGTSKIGKNNNYSNKNDMVGLKLGEAKRTFLQKFMSEDLSTAQKLQQSLKICDPVDVLDSNNDLFLKFLQEPNSLFTKHLHDLQAVSSSPQSNEFNLLKSLKASKHDDDELYFKSVRKMDGHMQFHNDSESSLQKQEYGDLNHIERDFPIRHRWSKSNCERNSGDSNLPTRIVVLKPSRKVHDANSISSLGTFGSSHFIHKENAESWTSRSKELSAELRGQPRVVDNMDLVKHRPKVSRETAQTSTQKARHAISNDSDLSTNTQKGYFGDESSDSMSGIESMKESEISYRSSRHLYDRSGLCSPSSSFSVESTVSKEAKKRLSERWKMTQKFQEVAFDKRDSNTLGEMLANQEKERLQKATTSKIAEIASCDRLSRNQIIGRRDTSLGIWSTNEWNKGNFRSPTRLGRRSKSSSAYQNLQSRSVNGSLDVDKFFVSKEALRNTQECIKEGSYKDVNFSVSKPDLHKSVEDDLSIREIHMDTNEEKFVLEASHVPDKIQFLPEPMEVSSHASFSECEDVAAYSKIQDDRSLERTSSVASLDGEDRKSCDYNHKNVIMHSMKETPHYQFKSESPGGEAHERELTSPSVSKDTEQPSPVSVLEPPNESESAELSTSECFESISAGLHGLRMQLQLLKFDSMESPTDGSDVIISSDEDAEDVEERYMTCGSTTHVEDRDFSYLLDMLIYSGFHTADLDMLFAMSYSLEQPVDPYVFDNLEKKHGRQTAWPRWERRLLFDWINSVLAEILKPYMDLHPWEKPKWRRTGIVCGTDGLVDEVWKLLKKRMEEGHADTAEKVTGRDAGWMDLGDDVDVIGQEIERSLLNGLMDEIIAGFSSNG